MDDQPPGGGSPAEDPDAPRPRRPAEGKEGSGQVFLVDRRPETDTRGPWIGVAVAAVAVAAGAAFVLFGPLVGGGDPSGSGAEPRAAVSAADTPADTSGTAAAAAASTAGSAAARGAASDFARQANSADAALSRYEERRALFEEGRLGCEALGAAHDAVDRTFVAVALTVRNRGGQLDDGARARFDELATRADAANRHFAGTACEGDG